MRVINDREWDMLIGLWHLRYLATEQIYGARFSERTAQACRTRLSRLAGEGLIKRAAASHPTRRWAWRLGATGLTALAEKTEQELKPYQELTAQFIPHLVETNDVFFGLTAGGWTWGSLPFRWLGSHRCGLPFVETERDGKTGALRRRNRLLRPDAMVIAKDGTTDRAADHDTDRAAPKPRVFIELTRSALLFWHNVVVARLAGADLTTPAAGFPKLRFDLRAQLAATPPDKYFLGLDPRRRPVYLTEWDLDTHGHVMGHTGSGKTKSVLEPLMLQDMRRGKGVLFMDAKGSSENVDMVKALASITDRRADLRVFALAYPEWSQTYNPVYLGRGGDPLAAAERVFSVFCMDNEYYRGQAKLFFYSLVRLLAATGKPFNLVDCRLCVADDDVLHHVFDLSDDRGAKFEITRQLDLYRTFVLEGEANDRMSIGETGARRHARDPGRRRDLSGNECDILEAPGAGC